MDATYTTIQGDAWDTVARRVYGNESYTTHLMSSNFPLLDIFIFDAGTVLQTPPVAAETNAAALPDWRSSR